MALPVELLMLHDEHFIDDDELMLLSDVATRRREIDHGRYAKFSVLYCNDEECLGNLVPMFGRAIEELCMINIAFTNFVYHRWGHLLRTMNQPWLAPYKLEIFADVIRHKGAAVTNC